jgi:hypothetical protein
VSFAGVSLTLIVLVAIFLALVALAHTGYRRFLLSGIVAFYPATVIFGYFPWFSPTTAGAAIGLWVACFIVSFLALKNRIDGAPWPKMGRFMSGVGIALAAIAQLVALYVSVLPLETYFALPSWLTVAADISFALPVLLALTWVF